MNKNQAIQKLLHKSGLCIRKCSPVALSCVASAGVVVTAIAAAKATPRAVALVYADSRKKHDGDPYAYTKKEAFIAAWKCYIPAVAFGASTIACIMGANALNRRQQAALTSAYALVQSSYKEYKGKLKELYGEEAHNAIIDSIAKEKCKDISISANGGWYDSSLDFGEGMEPEVSRTFYDSFSQRYFESTIEKVIQAEYTKKVDGSASKVADTSFGGNAMMEWPKIYTKRWEENGVYHFRCSDVPQDDDWDCWCNYDRQNNQIDHFYTPIYFGSLVSGKLRSISGAANSVSTTAANEIAYAKANGNDWYTEVLADRLLLQDLLVMMARSTECQTAFGYGRCKSPTSGNKTVVPGAMDTKGMFWGSDDQTSGVKVFGMENVWGNLWRRTAGWINANGTQKVKLTRGTHDGSTAADYNTDGSGYISVANATPNGISGGYIDTMKTEAYGRLPVTANGSSSTYEADGMWFNNSQVDYAFVGGAWTNDLMVGPFCAYLVHAASHSYSYFGAALSCKPLAAA